MKKLLLAPFLLASIFLFGGELKANPGSRYELPDPGSSLSESQSNSKDVWYLLNQLIILDEDFLDDNFNRFGTVLLSFEKIHIINTDSKSNCLKLARNRDRWIESKDLGSGDGERRYESFNKCIKGVKDTESDSFLEIYSPISRRGRRGFNINKTFVDKHHSFHRLFFKNFNQCTFAKIKLDNWFSSLELKQLRFPSSPEQHEDGFYLKFATKCFNKT